MLLTARTVPLLVLGSVFFTAHAAALQPEPRYSAVRITHDAIRVSLEGAMSAWLDESNPSVDATVDEARAYVRPKSPGSRDLQPGDTHSLIWARAEIFVDSSAPPTNWVFALSPPNLRWVQTFIFDGVTGEHLGSERWVPSLPAAWKRRAAFQFLLRPGHRYVVVFRFPSARNLGFQAVRSDHFLREELGTNLGYGLFYGALLAVLLCHLAVWIAVRERVYLLYTMYLASQIACLAILDGTLAFRSYLTPAGQLMMFCGFLYTIEFLDLRRRLPRLMSIYRIFTATSVIVFIVTLMEPSGRLRAPIEYLGDWNIAGGAVLNFVATAMLWLSGWRLARISLVGLTVLFVGVIAHFSVSYGFVPRSGTSDWILKVAVCSAIIIISAGIADRVRALKLEAIRREGLQRLVQTICHDLANPLSVVMTWAEVKCQIDSGDRAWQAVKRAALEQKAILQRVRLLQAVEGGKLLYQPEVIPVAGIAEQFEFYFANQLRQKELRFETDIRLETPEAAVMGDPVFFQHSILNNLFSNAMKFSKPSGRIRLEIVEQRNEVFIAIQDWGIGIPKALRRELFSTQGASSREGTAGEKGTGFGMPLVRTALQTMGGRIRVESRAAGEGSGESGTRVELWLPKAIVPKLSSAEEDFRGKRADLSVARTESRVSAG